MLGLRREALQGAASLGIRARSDVGLGADGEGTVGYRRDAATHFGLLGGWETTHVALRPSELHAARGHRVGELDLRGRGGVRGRRQRSGDGGAVRVSESDGRLFCNATGSLDGRGCEERAHRLWLRVRAVGVDGLGIGKVARRELGLNGRLIEINVCAGGRDTEEREILGLDLRAACVCALRSRSPSGSLMGHSQAPGATVQSACAREARERATRSRRIQAHWRDQ